MNLKDDKVKLDINAGCLFLNMILNMINRDSLYHV